MKLTPHDICGMGNKQKKEREDINVNPDSDDSQENDKENLNTEDLEGYNPNWTLRKCCSRVLDNLSNIYPEQVYEILRTYLENDMQHDDWLVK